MDAIYRVAGQCDEAADALSTIARQATAIDAPPSVFGAAAAGRLAETGGALRDQLLLAVDARQRETEAAAHRLSELAAVLRVTAEQYAETDTDVSRRRVVEA